MFVFCLSVSALLVGLHSFVDSIETMAVLRCVAFAVSTGLVPITNSFVVETAPTVYEVFTVASCNVAIHLDGFLPL